VALGTSRIRWPANHGHPGVADQVGQASGNVKPTALASQFGAHSAVGKGSAVKIEEDRDRRA